MNRRRFIASAAAVASVAVLSQGTSAQTPDASPATSSDIRPVDVPGMPLTLSPDGTTVAGFGDKDTIRIWDTETFEVIAETEPFPEVSHVDERSMTWAPDSTSIAWSFHAARNLIDSDIVVFDLVSGTTTNLTRDDSTDELAVGLLDADSEGYVLDVDVYPAWSADGGDLVFARTTWGGDRHRGTSLCRISRDGGEVEELGPVSPDLPIVVSSIRAGFEDGSVLFTTWPPELDDPVHGVFRMPPNGVPDGISTGMPMQKTPLPILLDIAPAAGKASMVSQTNYGTLDSPDGPIWFELDLESGVPTSFEEILSVPSVINDASGGDQIQITAPAFLTDEEGAITGYLYATSDLGFEEYTLRRHDTASGESTPLGTFQRGDDKTRGAGQFSRIETGTNGTAAIFHGGRAWMASVKG